MISAEIRKDKQCYAIKIAANDLKESVSSQLQARITNLAFFYAKYKGLASIRKREKKRRLEEA